MGELTCDSCGCHPNVIYTNSTGRFCERCKPANGLLTLKFGYWHETK